jgi:hypothetical protein
MDFIARAKVVHNGKYDYSLIQNLVKRDTRVNIGCPIHGVFEQSFHKHVQGDGCRQCGILAAANRRIDCARRKFIDESNTLHDNKYDYSKTVYVNAIELVIVTCPVHGDFQITPNRHLSGGGCKKCVYESLCQRSRIPWETYKQTLISVHGDLYDYSKVQWNGVDNHITVICKKHGEFNIRAQSHKQGRGCAKCSNESTIQYNKLNTKTFIERSIKIWGETYDYSKVDYSDSTQKIRIICRVHGEFDQLPSNHYKYGCPSCGRKLNVRNNELKDRCRREFVEKANKIHKNKYTYDHSNYIDAVTKVIVTCATHGDFNVSPNNHLRGKGCPACGLESVRISKVKSFDECNLQFKTLYGDKYDYSNVTWCGSSTPISVICKHHGVFHILPYLHAQGRECPSCTNQYSKISIEWLSYMEIVYATTIRHALNGGEYRIPNTRYKADGYSEERGMLFEFQGDFWHGNPALYDANAMNRRCGVSYGELHKKTTAKLNEIRTRGYAVVACWESDWIKLKQSIRILQKIWRTRNNENQESNSSSSVKNNQTLTQSC